MMLTAALIKDVCCIKKIPSYYIAKDPIILIEDESEVDFTILEQGISPFFKEPRIQKRKRNI